MIREKFLKIVCFGVCFLCFTAACVNSSTELYLTKNVKKYLEYSNKKEYGIAVQIFRTFSEDDHKSFIRYMEVYPEAISPLFYMVTADFYTINGEYDKGFLWFQIGKYRSLQDTLMCEDKSAQAQFAIYNKLAPETISYFQRKNADNDKYLADILKKTLEWDDAHPKRFDPFWPCYHGISAFSGEPKLLPEDKQAEIRQKLRNFYLEQIDELSANSKK